MTVALSMFGTFVVCVKLSAIQERECLLQQRILFLPSLTLPFLLHISLEKKKERVTWEIPTPRDCNNLFFTFFDSKYVPIKQIYGNPLLLSNPHEGSQTCFFLSILYKYRSTTALDSVIITSSTLFVFTFLSSPIWILDYRITAVILKFT